MTDTINEARALLADTECNDTIGAVTVRVVVRAIIADLEAARAELARVTEERDEWKRAAMMHTAGKVQAWTEREKAEAELAAARAAMPTADDVSALTAVLCDYARDGAWTPGTAARVARLVDLGDRLTAYHAAHPAQTSPLPSPLDAEQHIEITPEMREAQRRSFAYGNVTIDNPTVTRERVDAVADAMEAAVGVCPDCNDTYVAWDDIDAIEAPCRNARHYTKKKGAP